MKPGAWKEFLLPKEPEEDPAFREEIARLSLVGIRIIAAVSAGAGALGYLLMINWSDAIPAWNTVSDAVSATFLIAAVGLTFWSKAAPHARAIGLTAMTLESAGQILPILYATDLRLDGRTFVPTVTAFMLLLTIAALPVKPWQTLALGLWLTGLFFGASYGRTRYVQLSFEDAFPVSMMVIVTFATCALTAVLYRQRFEAFHGRRSAEKSYDALEAASGKLLISETAASQNRLAAALCHELNTPLGTLSSALSTLARVNEKRREKFDDRDERLQAAATAAGETAALALERLRETVERMKRVTNLDRAELQRVDVNQLWRDTVELLDASVAEKADFELTLEPVPEILGRPQQLAAVFSNLLRNAAAAMERHGTVRVSTVSENGEIVMVVEDDGKGIDGDALTHLFEPTFRAEHGRVGTGNWGLFTSRGVVAAHGGDIEIESELGNGTIARVRLPVSSKTLS